MGLGCSAWPDRLGPAAIAGSPRVPLAAPLPSQRLAPLFPASSLLLLFGGFPAWSPRDPPSALEETAESPGRAPRGGLWPERTPACTPGLAFQFGDGGWAHGAGSGAATAPGRPFRVLFCFFRLLSAPSPLKNKKNLASSLPVTLPPSCGSKESRPPRPPPARPLAVWPLQSLARPWHLPSSRVTSASCIPPSPFGSRLPRPFS